MVTSPKVDLRDGGRVPALLGIATHGDLLVYAVAGMN
jgi:hypothetical protein